MTENADKRDPPSLKEFSSRLDAVRGAKAAQENHNQARGQPLGQGFRLASELVAAVIVGLALGIGADAAFGVSPAGLLIGLFLGFAAGFVNVSRSFSNPDSDGSNNVDGS